MNTAESSRSGRSKVNLVTGGAGMLGRAIVSQLLERGQVVRIIDIEPAKDDRVEIMVGDIRDAAAVRRACEGVDTVFHTAAAVWDPKLPLGIYEETNVKGTQIIIDTCLQMEIPRLVYSGTLDVVLDGKHGHLLADESVPYPTDVKKMNRYAYSKMLGEQAVIKANGPALSTCSLRLVGMYGPGDRYHLPNIIKVAKSGIRLRLGNGKAQFNHVFSGNAAHAHVLAAEHLGPGSPVAGQVYFINDHDTGNFFAFMDPFLEGLGMRGPKIAIPYRLAYALAWLVERFTSQSNFNRFSVYSTCVDSTFVHNKAKRDFGYHPRFSAEEAFKITLEWLKTQTF
ncbi:MAG: NAD-dependent epimerase/dehydratase family protein [Dehalococcoidia bacterium]|nr:NAD-dependent epimerase/dehydratase family protein [Dehalococcoidia bacterium]